MFTCISCRIAFDVAEEQRSHFGTDWHRYNMKRRVANLPPISALAFNEKVIERREKNAIRPDPKGMECSPCNKSFSSENSFRSHIQSKKHRERETLLAGISGSVDSHSEIAQSTPIIQELDALHHANSNTDAEEQTIDEKIAASRRRVHPNDCLFCSHRSIDIETNLSHMRRNHSFFVPDQDLLLDITGLLAYLGEKVVVGNLCLFCPDGGKEFGSLEAVRRHMIDKGHCKIAYDSDMDRAELADFYDFDGVDDDLSDWEDIGDETGVVTNSQMPTIATDGLSLLLPSGRVLGHRALKRYYSQRLRPPIASEYGDSTKSKIALLRDHLADPRSALVPSAGGHGSFGRGLEMVKARNPGEARWARKQGGLYKDQRARENFKTLVGYRNNSQKHFRDPLLQ